MQTGEKMNTTSMWRAFLGGGLLLLSLSGCVTVRGHTPTKPPVRLFLETGFQLQRSPLDSAPGSVACTVIRARGTVQAVRGDTLLLANVETLTRPPAAAACPDLDVAMVVISSYPDLQAETVRVDGAGTAILGVALIPAIVLGSLALGVLVSLLFG